MTDNIQGRRDTHLDIPLDDDPPVMSREPVFVDVVAKSAEVKPIIPASFRSWSNLKAWTSYQVGLNARRAGYHAARTLQIYLPLMLFWSVVGVFRLANRQRLWWWQPQMTALLDEAVAKGDLHAGPKINRDLSEQRKARFFALLAELVALAVAVVLLWALAPRWAQVAAVVLALPWLAHVGRPQTMPILRPAVVAHRFRRINSDIVLRAYYSAGLGHPDKPHQQVTFASTMQRDQRETGSQVAVDVPFGVPFSEVVKAKEKLASGLDVHVNQVFLTADKTSNRRHLLFVADRDPLAIPAGVTDLLDCKPRNIWRPILLGKDERDNVVTIMLVFLSVLVGAQPRRGKTFFTRLIALFAALDPNVRLLLADGKMSPDWNKFSLVAHRMVVGDTPNTRDHDPLTNMLEMLDEILAHIDQVNDELSALPVEMCPEGKLTEELHRDPRYPNLKVWVVVLEEFQVYFETVDQEFNKKLAQKLARIQAVGPSAGVILLSSSQKPSGVGAGDVGRLFNRFRDNHLVRFALKCGSRDVSISVLSGDAYQEGYDASALPAGDEYRGVGILYGASNTTPTVRTLLADHKAAETILLAARKYREQAGTLSGLAAGEDMSREYRDFLADVRRVFYAGEAWISWPQIAQRLSEELPEHYADVTAEAISAQARALKVPSVDGRDKTQDNKVVKGAKVAAVEAAMERRRLESGR
jgi:S-DNA-T family DNA segregation ATPase FtsK/SpoIIIE